MIIQVAQVGPSQGLVSGIFHTSACTWPSWAMQHSQHCHAFCEGGAPGMLPDHVASRAHWPMNLGSEADQLARGVERAHFPVHFVFKSSTQKLMHDRESGFSTNVG